MFQLPLYFQFVHNFQICTILNFQISEKFNKDTIWPTLIKNPNAAPDRRKRP